MTATAAPMESCPFLTHALPSIGGVVRATPDDFVVEELPAYLPSGEGEHLYVTFTKRGLTTNDALRALATALDADPRQAGYAGMKDKHAVTTQTVSLWKGDARRAMELALPGITVLDARRHNNKLRTGHLHGNRFVLRVRNCASDAEATARAVADALLRVGVPNYYGAQRFGHEGLNAERGRAWLKGETNAPRDPNKRKLFASAVQSDLFNRYLAGRLRDGLLDRYVDGDLAERHPINKSFLVDPAEAPALYASRAVSPTGPMYGTEMRWPERAARAREEELLANAGLSVGDFARARDLGRGTRRALRMVLDGLEVSAEAGEGGAGPTIRLAFALPAGGYATAVLREFRKSDTEATTDPDGSTRRENSAASPDETETVEGADHVEGAREP